MLILIILNINAFVNTPQRSHRIRRMTRTGQRFSDDLKRFQIKQNPVTAVVTGHRADAELSVLCSSRLMLCVSFRYHTGHRIDETGVDLFNKPSQNWNRISVHRLFASCLNTLCGNRSLMALASRTVSEGKKQLPLHTNCPFPPRLPMETAQIVLCRMPSIVSIMREICSPSPNE